MADSEQPPPPPLGSLEVLEQNPIKIPDARGNTLKKPDLTELKIWKVMVKDDITPELLCKVCRQFMRESGRNIDKPNNKRNWVPIRYPLPCIHSKFNEDIECFSIGHLNKEKKYSQVRQSTFINWTYKYLAQLAEKFPEKYGDLSKYKNLSTQTSKAFFKSYHIALISRFSHEKTSEETEGNGDKRFLVRHLCGCSYCCNPHHLKFGHDLQNRADQAYHVTRDLCCATQEHYNSFKEFIAKSRPESMADVII